MAEEAPSPPPEIAQLRERYEPLARLEQEMREAARHDGREAAGAEASSSAGGTVEPSPAPAPVTPTQWAAVDDFALSVQKSWG